MSDLTHGHAQQNAPAPNRHCSATACKAQHQGQLRVGLQQRRGFRWPPHARQRRDAEVLPVLGKWICGGTWPGRGKGDEVGEGVGEGGHAHRNRSLPTAAHIAPGIICVQADEAVGRAADSGARVATAEPCATHDKHMTAATCDGAFACPG